MADEREMIVLQTFPNRIEAEMAEGALHGAEIDAMVSGDDAGGIEPGLWTRGVRLLVWQEDADRAREILNSATEVPAITILEDGQETDD